MRDTLQRTLERCVVVLRKLTTWLCYFSFYLTNLGFLSNVPVFRLNSSSYKGQDAFCSTFGSIATERWINFAAWGLGLRPESILRLWNRVFFSTSVLGCIYRKRVCGKIDFKIRIQKESGGKTAPGIFSAQGWAPKISAPRSRRWKWDLGRVLYQIWTLRTRSFWDLSEFFSAC